MGARSLTQLKTANRNFDNVLDSYLNLTDGGTVTGAIVSSGGVTVSSSATLGFRGAQFLETGAVFAPYIPLIMTPLVYDPASFTPRKGIMTRYAKKMVRPDFYGKVIISDLNEI